MPIKNTCFGILPFRSRSIDNRFKNIIHPLVETHTGLVYEDARVYYEAKNEKMDLISRMVEDAKLVIVDISEDNPNVFFEFGIAYHLKKPIIILCKKSEWKKVRKEKLPFDIQGREILIYKDNAALRVQLGKYIFDSLYPTQEILVSWESADARNYFKSPTEIQIYPEPTDPKGEIWSSKAVDLGFTIEYHVKIHEPNGKNPDIRLHFSHKPGKEGYPRITIIFPWEYNCEECHIDYFYDPKEQRMEERLQQVPVAKQNIAIKEFDVLVSFCWPNLVFESPFFGDAKPRVNVSLNLLRNKGFPLHLAQYIGFASPNSQVTISDIKIKEISHVEKNS
ncbi:MAG: hypothetical protein V2A78_03855 [bacterium]